MSVPVKRYQRYQKLGDKTSPVKYYLKQEPGTSQVLTIKSVSRAIEAEGALSAEDVKHVMQSFVRKLKEALTVGNKVRIEGLGTFFMTFTTAGTTVEKECTVKNIKRVNIRFAVDNALRLANDSTATTRGGENNVLFYIKGESSASGGGEEGGGDDPVIS